MHVYNISTVYTRIDIFIELKRFVIYLYTEFWYFFSLSFCLREENRKKYDKFSSSFLSVDFNDFSSFFRVVSCTI